MAFFLEAEGFLRAARPDNGVVKIPGRGGGGGGGPWQGDIPSCGGRGGGGGGGGKRAELLEEGTAASCTVSETGRIDKWRSFASTGRGTGEAGILHSGETDRGIKEGCAGGQGSGGGYCIHFFEQGLDGGVRVTDKPAPENIEQLADLLDQS